MTTAELAQRLSEYRKAAHRLQVMASPSDAAEHIAHMYNWAGATDSEANARGAKMIRVGAQIMEALRTIEAQLGQAQVILKTASDYADEQDAKRRSQASKYKV